MGIDKTRDLEYQIRIFKAIYTTMYRAQDNIPFFKTNFLDKKENMSAKEWEIEIKNHCEKQPASRTAKAWQLAEEHFDNCNTSNIGLLNEMYDYVCKHKTHFGVTFFSSLIEPGHLTKEKIDGADYYKDSVLWGIKFWLNVEIHKMRIMASANRSFSAISYEESETTAQLHF
ncbi:hypothetical protein [Legionella longbeachae]|uniref:hypothetical protein n=1 Tax=Legionella longbeachae TaxID=450 RepID=UPI001244614C|nr:hypothetical protein [Legionella longbeachae]QEY52474.1 hypothetical protein FQU71_15280 [Legionella longbeachae]